MPIRFRVLIGLAILAGCAEPPPPPPPPPSPLDGTYKGSASGSCGAAQTTATVRDGHFTLIIGDTPPLDGVAQTDGSLRANVLGPDGREINFTGHIDGPELRGGSYNGRCAFAFSMTRQS